MSPGNDVVARSMNIAMFTNTYVPHVGGVARSVDGLTNGLRARGHQVLVIAPEFDGMPENESRVIRVPAIQHFEGSDYSFPIPASRRLAAALREFKPDVIHSHHPFLLGDTALRIGASHNIPVVFTYHTRYEHYSHYMVANSPRIQRFALDLALGYTELCDAVVAPSGSVATFLQSQGIKIPILTIPSGIALATFEGGDRQRGRALCDIPDGSFVVGHVGRLAPEKNLEFLADCLAGFCLANPRAHCVIAGSGPLRPTIEAAFNQDDLKPRLHLLGVLDKSTLADVYHAMDVFAFSSYSETQGLVLAEAMACSVPIVALDASGVREIVSDGVNGRLLAKQKRDDFVAALQWVSNMDWQAKQSLNEEARLTAQSYSQESITARVSELYSQLISTPPLKKAYSTDRWHAAGRSLAKEWKILRNISHALSDAVFYSAIERD